jgi:hypothetical protein
VSSAGAGDGLAGIDTGVGSGVGRALPECLELLNVVSTGVGNKRFLPAKPVRSTESLPADGRLAAVDTSSTFLELRVVVSTGSGANLRTFFELSSVGTGWKRRDKGGVSDIVREPWRSFPITQLL